MIEFIKNNNKKIIFIALLSIAVVLTFVFKDKNLGARTSVIQSDNYVGILSNISTYVSTSTGSDLSTNCDISTPCKTINKAISYISKYSVNGTSTVNIADGTYNEAVVIPQNITGVLKLQGNSTTPDNVVIYGGDTSTTVGITIQYSKAKTIINGIKFSTHNKAIDLVNSQLELGYNKFYNFKIGVALTRNARLVLPTGYAASSVFDGNNVAVSSALNASTQSSIENNLPITMTGVYSGFFINQGSSVRNATNANITISGSTSTANALITIRENSVFSSGLATFNLTSTGTTGIGVEITNSKIFLTANSVLNLSYFKYGVKLYGNSVWNEGSQCDFVPVGNTIDAYVDERATVDSKYIFDSMPNVVLFDGYEVQNPTATGYDYRYQQFYPIVSSTVGDASTTIWSYATASLGSNRGIAVSSTIIVQADIIGTKLDGTARVAFTRYATMYRTGTGNLTQQGPTKDVYTENSAANTTVADFSINATYQYPLIVVKGVSAETWNWTGRIKFIYDRKF